MEKAFSPQVFDHYRSRLKKSTAKKSSKKKEEPAAEPIPAPEFLQEEQDETRLSLEELAKLIDLQQTATIDSEVDVKGIRQEAKENLRRISSMKSKIDEWQANINAALDEIDSLEENSIDILARHEDALNKLHENQSILQAYRSQYEGRTVVFILVDGKNEPEAEMDGKPYTLKFGDWNPVYEEIVSRSPETLGDLRFSEVIQIAKVLSLPDDMVYDITFASQDMENVYDSMRDVNAE